MMLCAIGEELVSAPGQCCPSCRPAHHVAECATDAPRDFGRIAREQTNFPTEIDERADRGARVVADVGAQLVVERLEPLGHRRR